MERNRDIRNDGLGEQTVSRNPGCGGTTWHCLTRQPAHRGGQSDSIGSKHNQASRERGKAKLRQGNARWASDFERQVQNSVGLGPHLLAASAGDKQQEYRFVVLDERPDKFNLEIK